MARRIPAILLMLVAVQLCACVDEGTRTETTEPVAYAEDPGSGPYSCDQDADVILTSLDHFEFGSASGSWFANNDVCDDCQKLSERRTELMNAAEAGTGAGAELESVETALRVCREECEAAASPNFFDKPVPAARISPAPRCESNFGIHLTSPGLYDWGANLGNNFGVSKDASAHDGISFWARRASHSRGVIRVEMSDQYTEPGKVNAQGVETALCTHEYSDDEIQKGCDRFGSFATVSTTWQFFKLPFSEMRQSGWGAKVPRLDTQTLYSVTFLFPTGTWDIWIDDVSFYTERN